MSFRADDEVFVVSMVDTGIVTDVPAPSKNSVSYDEIRSSGEHHDDDLCKLPVKNRRIYKESFYFIISAQSKDGKRSHETRCVRLNGGRIYTKRSRSEAEKQGNG